MARFGEDLWVRGAQQRACILDGDVGDQGGHYDKQCRPRKLGIAPESIKQTVRGIAQARQLPIAPPRDTTTSVTHT
jgi:hypothetical protein